MSVPAADVIASPYAPLVVAVAPVAVPIVGYGGANAAYNYTISHVEPNSTVAPQGHGSDF